MSDQFISLFSEIKNYIPFVSFVAGIGGGVHCVGMCGGLVTASCHNSTDVVKYQIGRLFGYLILGLMASALGSMINFGKIHPTFALLPSILIGVLFIYWGIQNFQGKKAELPLPQWMGRLYKILWSKLVHKNKTFSQSIFTGFISILLPCGLLYGVVLSTLALEHIYLSMLSIFFFWLGTVPSMVLAPSMLQKVLSPFKSKLPKTYAIGLVFIGVLTISMRAIRVDFASLQLIPSAQDDAQCH